MIRIKVVKEAFSFIEVYDNAKIDTASMHNVGGKSWKIPFLKQFFMKDNFFKKCLRAVFSKVLRKRVRLIIELVLKEETKPIKINTRISLLNYFKSRYRKIGEIIEY